jgi:RNA-directed DNA polymerase
LLANIYLDPLDHKMVQQGKRMVRYADDFILLCHNEAEAQEALAQVRHWMEEAGLRLHQEKTRIVNTSAGTHQLESRMREICLSGSEGG